MSRLWLRLLDPQLACLLSEQRCQFLHRWFSRQQMWFLQASLGAEKAADQPPTPSSSAELPFITLSSVLAVGAFPKIFSSHSSMYLASGGALSDSLQCLVYRYAVICSSFVCEHYCSILHPSSVITIVDLVAFYISVRCQFHLHCAFGTAEYEHSYYPSSSSASTFYCALWLFPGSHENHEPDRLWEVHQVKQPFTCYHHSVHNRAIAVL